ncbi:fluoride efflux transporter CrcB [Isoptericola sp. b408]|uniref:fluoride efflux transporter CrcB n=1 Tax=Isoptericola sp. b408 TaxID=3064653 RepID=UPI0027123516|nr:fluoride efflux transporter CrcB [Isoptericola sp. b408]MDO8149863.1 fluoride efflux transporter CrcB [Isoptericola sp. b408]
MSGLLGALLVGIGGGVGAAARFWLADTVKARRPDGFPWGTWIVNVLGSLLIGLVTGWFVFSGDASPGELLLAVGVCGGFTTFSTSIVETATMLRGGRPARAVVHALSTLGVSVLAVAGGLGLMAAVLG